MSSVAISGSNSPTSTIALLRKAQMAPDTVRIRPQTRWARRSTETIEANSVAWTLAEQGGGVGDLRVARHGGDAAMAEVADEVAQRVRPRLDVGVDDADDLGPRDRDGVVERHRLALVDLLGDEPDVPPRRVAGEDLRRAVRGAVVDHDDLVARVVQREQRGERALDDGLLAVGGHDDGDVGQLVLGRRRERVALVALEEDERRDGPHHAGDERVRGDERERDPVGRRPPPTPAGPAPATPPPPRRPSPRRRA